MKIEKVSVVNLRDRKNVSESGPSADAAVICKCCASAHLYTPETTCDKNKQ